MPRRAASVTQADIARAVRALRASGYQNVRVVIREGGVVVEPAPAEGERRDFRHDDADDDAMVVL